MVPPRLRCRRSVGFMIEETDIPAPSNESFMPAEQAVSAGPGGRAGDGDGGGALSSGGK